MSTSTDWAEFLLQYLPEEDWPTFSRMGWLHVSGVGVAINETPTLERYWYAFKEGRDPNAEYAPELLDAAIEIR